jgi:antitoxin component of MazEF toxin-antitoxin module
MNATIEDASVFSFIAEARKWGSSVGLVIPVKVRADLDLVEGSFVEVKIKKVDLTLDSAKCYECKTCQHRFESRDEHPYCSACDGESLREVQE